MGRQVPPSLPLESLMLDQDFGSMLYMATLLFAPQPLAYARGSVRRRFGAANVRERMRNYL